MATSFENMQLTTADVSRIFDDLLRGVMTREEAELWAEERMRLDDADRLAFTPAEAEATLRDAVHYLAGVAIRDTVSTYLHSPQDFRAYRQERGL